MKQILKFSLILILSCCIPLSAQKESQILAVDAPNKDAGIQNQIENQWDILLMFGTKTLSGDPGNVGCEWDGTNFYSTRLESNLIHKYNSTGTTLVEQFSIAGVSGLRDLAYDGTYMYGGSATNVIYKMDFNTHTLVETISSPVPVRYIAYDPGSDAFWVGGWNDSPTLVTRTGTILKTITTGLYSQYGACYDSYSTGEPTIWIYDQGSSDAILYQFDIATGTATGFTHNVSSDMPNAGGSAGGLFAMEDFANGFFTIGGLYQSNSVGGNDEIFIYEVTPIQDCIPAASNPNPTNNTTEVDINANISWTNDSGANTIELIFNGTTVYSGVPITTWDPDTLNYFTTYTWKIKEYTDSCLIISPTWSFKTQQNPNLIIITDYFYPQNANYWTGTTDGMSKTDVSEVRASDLECGWFMFDISSIPDYVTIDSIRFYGYVNNTYYPYFSATPLPALNPLTATASGLKNTIQNNSNQSKAYIYSNESPDFSVGWHNYLMGNTANIDLKAKLTQDWFAMGMYVRDNPNSTYYLINFDGWAQTNIPYLKVTYEYIYVPPTVVDPTGVSATAINDTQIDVAFMPNVDNNNVVIVFNIDGVFTTPTGTPVIGGSLAGGTVLDVTLISPYSHIGLTANTQYFYKIFSYNGSNYSSGVTTEAITEATNTFQLSVPVNDGWNMLSIPGLHPSDQNVETWWSAKDPTANVFKYSGGYIPVTTATPTEGYWMKHQGPNTYNTGDEWPAGGIQYVSHDPITASVGWNLIGGYDYNAQTSGITTNPSGLIESSIFGYSGGYNPAAEMVPGYGYWVKLSGAGQIILPPSTFKGTTKSTDSNLDNFGRIIITDNTGNSYTLYASNGNTDLKTFELPPAPPSGMFDVRYSSGRYAEDISSANQTIEMNGLVYPVRVRTEKMNLTVQDESGKEVNAILSEGEEITISNSMINKLIVQSGEITSPTEYSLEQNYPNPFNPSTMINYVIPAESFVTIKVFDILGREVMTLVNEVKKAGKYEIEFSGSELSTGMYIYRMESGNFTSTQKMLLIK